MRCDACSKEATTHADVGGFRFCEACMKELDERIIRALIETLGPKLTELPCDICGEFTGTWAMDEDDRIWCSTCIDKWEEEHGLDWATGQARQKLENSDE